MLTAAEVNEERSMKVFVVDQCCMLPRATLVGQGEVTYVLGSAEDVAWLLIYQQLLERDRQREGYVHYTCTCIYLYVVHRTTVQQSEH